MSLTVNQQEIQITQQLKLGVPYPFKFELTNTGNSPVTIKNIVLGCNSCTKANVVNPVIPAGGKENLNVTFTPGSTGINVKSISVMYNDGTKELKLKFRATVNG